jgi:spore coat polysaccharide biosynthesis protein SpsF (cytidylyltransferase family)
MPKTVLIAQARMGSSRVPGKVLKPLAGMPVVEHVLRRAAAAREVDQVCLATTDEPQDDPLTEAVTALGFAVFRGSHKDVLSRYAGAARMTQADIVIRVTCDCPLLDPQVVDNVVALRRNAHADYASNGLILDWPDGLDCEIFTSEVLFAAEKNAQSDYEKEHVTPWIRTTGAKMKAHLSGPGMPRADQRWTLDTPEDLIFLDELFKLISPPPAMPGWQEIMNIVETHPRLEELNAHLRRKELPK